MFTDIPLYYKAHYCLLWYSEGATPQALNKERALLSLTIMHLWARCGKVNDS